MFRPGGRGSFGYSSTLADPFHSLSLLKGLHSLATVEYSCTYLLRRYAHTSNLSHGRAIHTKVASIFTFPPAFRKFLLDKNILSWNAMIAGVLSHGLTALSDLKMSLQVYRNENDMVSCQVHGDPESEKCGTEHALALDGTDPSMYVLLSNMHACISNWDGAGMLSEMVKIRKWLITTYRS
ncbi:hypothetical protein FEM48_Zijuj05G0184900 [Ziziphus jujuba var. spinosa]|uniref:Uncharacterized protein n=1 Tax=Ziziphus jujuba var. spinosa TaxID=714518 RepID=A0A978VGF8_ZIZJJ|nr:hypothetical protein FEM48_Zijuj05G0184900 [Ziziphus jujuba var. spinosa]